MNIVALAGRVAEAVGWMKNKRNGTNGIRQISMVSL
jgi:hypothetical protein